MRWHGAPSYERIAAFAEGIRHGLAATIARRKPLYIMLDGDIAQTLGAILREELKVESEILVIDGVTLCDFDYIDLGRIRLPSYTVPVTIKSLVFSEDPRRGRPHQRIHHHEHAHSHDHGHHDHHHDHDRSWLSTRHSRCPELGRLPPHAGSGWEGYDSNLPHAWAPASRGHSAQAERERCGTAVAELPARGAAP